MLSTPPNAHAYSLSDSSLRRLGYREAQGETLALPKMGDERSILRCSITIVRNLYLGISNNDFDFNETRDITRGNKAALWNGCTFKVER